MKGVSFTFRTVMYRLIKVWHTVTLPASHLVKIMKGHRWRVCLLCHFIFELLWNTFCFSSFEPVAFYVLAFWCSVCLCVFVLLVIYKIILWPFVIGVWYLFAHSIYLLYIFGRKHIWPSIYWITSTFDSTGRRTNSDLDTIKVRVGPSVCVIDCRFYIPNRRPYGFLPKS